MIKTRYIKEIDVLQEIIQQVGFIVVGKNTVTNVLVDMQGNRVVYLPSLNVVKVVTYSGQEAVCQTLKEVQQEIIKLVALC